MKFGRLLVFAVAVVGIGHLPAVALAQYTVPQQLSILDEKLSRLRADVEALQFNQQQMQQELRDIQNQLMEFRRGGSGASASELEARIRAVDAAREADKKVILDQLSRELAAVSTARPSGSSPSATSSGASAEHVVQKGETLAVIAKTYGASVADIVRANNLSNPNEIRVGQKLIIPK